MVTTIDLQSIVAKSKFPKLLKGQEYVKVPSELIKEINGLSWRTLPELPYAIANLFKAAIVHGDSLTLFMTTANVCPKTEVVDGPLDYFEAVVDKKINDGKAIHVFRIHLRNVYVQFTGTTNINTMASTSGEEDLFENEHVQYRTEFDVFVRQSDLTAFQEAKEKDFNNLGMEVHNFWMERFIENMTVENFKPAIATHELFDDIMHRPVTISTLCDHIDAGLS